MGESASRDGLTRRELIGGALAGAAVVSLGSLEGPLTAVARAAAPKRGGQLRIGMVGGGTAETLDPHK